jgi:hypothetical protein
MRGIIRRTVTIITTTTWTIRWRDDWPQGEWQLPADCLPEPATRLATGQEPSLLPSESGVAAKEGHLSNEVEESGQ